MKAIAANLCNNVLFRANKEKIPVTQMKLQKLMYYICRDYVLKTGESPIFEQFEVWKYGPVLPSIYGLFKSFKSKPITDYAKDIDGKCRKVRESKNPILATVIDIVWAKYKRMTGVELSNMTHCEGSGWYRAYIEGRTNITIEDMQNDIT